MANTVKTDTGIEVYQDDIRRLCDEYISDLDDTGEVKAPNKAVFTGMLKYIYINLFKVNPLDNNNIQEIDRVWDIYTSLCYKYSKRPTILNFSLMVGINNDTFNAWKNGEYRNDGSELGSLHSRTVKKWLSECESTLVDGAIENNSIGCIFALKANYGYVETAQRIEITNGSQQQKSVEQIAAEHAVAQISDKQTIEPPDDDF